MTKSDVVIVKDLYKSFVIGGNKIMIIKGLSFSVSENETLIIKGPSGSGKTTILKILLGMLKPDAGIVRVFGVDPFENPYDVRKRIGYLPQDILLIPQLSIWENIIFYLDGRKKYRNDYIRHTETLLEMLGIRYLVRQYPESLSGGEIRRAELALALSDKPPLLLLDEPTAMIDQENVQRVIEVLKYAKEWSTIILTTHDPRLDILADTIITI
ncbi:MAG: ATP-binding cassette domain-containing protein [Desulfurococcales archaeon]|nr:ATP-binding cassette domain-containing protein [Desulfurococcales archaeon]